MGKKDSSLTRVQPVFDSLMLFDDSGKSWIPELFHLAAYGHPNAKPFTDISKLENRNWGHDEAKLKPPISLLSWLIRNLKYSGVPKPTDNDKTSEKRKLLFDQDPKTIIEALDLINTKRNNEESTWYILEGNSQPDVYIETKQSLIVIEGKRTESGPTTKTTWMSERHQMLRHLDAAWEISGNRNVYGLFIVEGLDDDNFKVPEKWIKAAKNTISDKAITKSLPQRGPNEQKEIAQCFHGILTWQMICRKFDINFSSLPDKLFIK